MEKSIEMELLFIYIYICKTLILNEKIWKISNMKRKKEMIQNFWPIILKDIFLTKQFPFFGCSIRNKIFSRMCAVLSRKKPHFYLVYRELRWRSFNNESKWNLVLHDDSWRHHRRNFFVNEATRYRNFLIRY